MAPDVQPVAAVRPAFPAELTRRTYDVALLETGTRLNILVGAPLDPRNIGARLEGRTVSFEVSAGSYYGFPVWSLVERIPPDLSLGIMGKAVATINDGATAMAGSFSGLFALYKGSDFGLRLSRPPARARTTRFSWNGSDGLRASDARARRPQGRAHQV